MALSDFLKANYHNPEKLDNKTNRWRYTCEHCSTVLTHRKNALLEHLSYPARCTKAPTNIRGKAQRELATKGSATEATAPVVKAPVLAEAQVEGIAPGAIIERLAKKARLSQPGMMQFTDVAMSKEQKQSADLAMIR